MSRVFPRTEPGTPADWHERAIIGAPRRTPVRPHRAFLLGLLLGVLFTALALA